MRRRYLRLELRLSEAPRTPVIMPEGTMPGPPGSGVTSPARRNRTRSINWLSPVDVPDASETARLWSSPRQSQRLCICADELACFPPRGFLNRARAALDFWRPVWARLYLTCYSSSPGPSQSRLPRSKNSTSFPASSLAAVSAISTSTNWFIVAGVLTSTIRHFGVAPCARNATMLDVADCRDRSRNIHSRFPLI